MNERKINAYRQSEEVLLNEYKLQRTEHFIPVNAYDLNVRVQEIGNGQPLLFIHVVNNAGSTWLEMASHLQDYRCIILDRPGCGLSEGLIYQGITPDKLDDLIVSVIDSVLDYFNMEKPSILASSFGGYWAIRYVLKNPGKIEKLILEGAPALIEGSNLPNFMKSIEKPFLKWLIPKLPGSVSNSEKTMKEIGHLPWLDNPDKHASLIKEFLVN